MVADNSLFLLIKSLSQAEKRYFKVFAARHVIGEQNNYVDLFDAIDRQVKRNVYDEKKLILFFKQKIAHFPSAKHYLFEMILKSLRAFHEGELLFQQVNDRISDIKLLMRRGLYKKSYKLLATAKKDAIAIDNNNLLLEILHLERLHIQRTKHKLTSRVYTELGKMELECICKLENDAGYRHIHDKLYFLLQHELTLRDKETKRQLNAITKSKLLQNDKYALTFTAKWNNLLSQSNYAQLLDKPEEAKYDMKQLVELFDKHPIIKREYAERYIGVLSDYLNSCFLQRDFEEFPRILAKMKDFKVESREDEFIIFSHGTFLELLYLIITNRLEEALQLVPSVSSGLKKFADKLTKEFELAFLGNVSAVYFLLGKWDDGLDWVNKIILRKPENVRYDIQSAVRILQLIMHLELHNYDLVGYLVRSHIRFYRKNKRYFQFEQICIQLVLALLKSPEKMKNKNLLVKYCDQLLVFKKRNKEFVLGFNEVLAWIESYTQQRPIRSIYHDLQKNE